MNKVNEFTMDGDVPVPANDLIALLNAARNTINKRGTWDSLADLKETVERIEDCEPEDE